ncbi:MAG: MFS transporter [Candidatus Kariarchaeaceae archaeon]|jgi:MFS family permease
MFNSISAYPAFNRFYKFFDISSLNYDARKFIAKSFNIMFIYNFIIMFTNTFIILFALEKISITQLGIILSIQFIVQGATDYPTGAIGDWIGQRWIIFVATIFYGIGFFLFSFVQSFLGLLIVFLILGFAQGQESGAFKSWFDNNYKIYVVEDKDRRLYGQVLGKFTMIKDIITGLSIILGGYAVTFASRSIIFRIEGIILAIVAFVFLFVIKDHPNLSKIKPNMREYSGFLTGGLKAVKNHDTLRLLIAGMVISGAGFALFAGLILFPLYGEYGNSDEWIAIVRAVIFTLAALLIGWAAIQSKKIYNLKKWLSITVLLTDFLFFIGILIMTSIYHVPNHFTVISVIVIIFTFTVAYIPRYLVDVLQPRFLLDIIPDHNRNAVYSLIPTLILIISIPYMVIGGVLIEILGRRPVIIILAVHGLLGSSISAYAIMKHQNPDELKQSDNFLAVKHGKKNTIPTPSVVCC